MAKRKAARRSKLSAATNRKRNTAKGRKRMRPSSFGQPGKRKYRLDDKAHAANAKARSTQQMKKRKISKATRDKIHARANKVLGKGKKKR
jgi:hypothetical protein